MKDLETVFRQRVTEARQGKMTTDELSAFMADELGITLHPSAITKLEKGKRGVSLQEAVGLALALGVPLPLLLTPTDSGEAYALTPSHHVPPGRALNWMLYGEPALDTDIKKQTPGQWRMNAFHRAVRANEEVIHHGGRVVDYDGQGQDDDQDREERHLYHLRLRELRDALNDLTRLGLEGVAEGWWNDTCEADLAELEAEARKPATIAELKEFFGRWDS